MRKLIAGQLLLIMAIAIALSVFGLSACSQAEKAVPSSSAQSLSSSSASDSNGASASTSSGLASSAQYVLANRPVIRDEQTGDIFICAGADEFNNLGFSYGDSVKIVFSNGQMLKGVPYCNGYYFAGVPFLAAFPNHLFIEVTMDRGGDLWNLGGLSDGDTATVTLEKAGEYYETQIASDLHYTDKPSDYTSEAVFANYRAMSGGNLKKDTFYRSATPISNVRNRAESVNHMMGDTGIKFVLDLSDTDDEVGVYLANDKEDDIDVSRFASLYESGEVKCLDLSPQYFADDYKHSLAEGLVEMTEHDGPYLIHCIEGKDRTGFVCMLLEALAGASYQEIVSDYMITYANYYGVSAANDPERYDAIKDLRIDDMLRFIGNVDKGTDLSSVDFVPGARKYLSDSGMSNAQIDALVDCLTE